MVSETGSAPHSAAPRPAARRLLARALLTIAALLLAICVGLAWLLQSERGTQWLLSHAQDWSAGTLQITDVDGRLAGPLRIGKLTIALPDKTIVLQDVQLEWQPLALLHGRLHVNSLHVVKLALASKIQQSSKPMELPADLGLPLKVQIDRMQVDGGEIAWGPMSLITLGSFASQLDYDGRRYLLNLERFSAQTHPGEQAFAGNISGTATLEAMRPFSLQLVLDSDSSTSLNGRTVSARAHLGLQGTLSDMRASLDLHAGQATISGKALLQPFSDRPLGATDLQIRNLNLAELVPSLPATQLKAALRVDAQGAGQLTMTNTAAGLWNEQRLPLASLLLGFTQDRAQFRFERIDATVGTAQRPAGRILGSGRYANGALTLNLKTDALDLKKIDARMRNTRLAGTLDVRHADARQDLTLALREPLARNALTLNAHALIGDDVVKLDRFALRAGNSAIDANAHIGLSGGQHFEAQATARNFDTRDLGDGGALPALLLNGDFSIKGNRQPVLEADLSFRIDRSRLGTAKDGVALSGDGRAQLRANTLDIAALQVQAGDNSLRAQGRLAERDARITYALHAPALQQLGSAFGGSLQLNGEVRGSVRQPQLTAQWEGKQLRLPNAVRIDATQGKATLGFDRGSALLLANADADASVSGWRIGQQQISSATVKARMAAAANAPLSIDLRMSGINSSHLLADNFALDVSGTTARHRLQAELNEREQHWKIAASGGLQDVQRGPRWQGTIDMINANGQLNAKLSAPAPLQISQRLVQLDRFTLEAEDARIAVEQFVKQGDRMSTRGHFEHLQPMRILGYLQPQTAVDADLKLAGTWDIRSNGQLGGSVSVQRESGDVRVLGSTPVTLGLTNLNANAQLDRGRLALTARVEGQRLGRIALDVSTSLGQGLALAPNAPLSGSAQINTPALGWLGPLISQTVVAEGSLQADVRFSGSMGDPHVSGQIAADKLRLLFTDTGIDLKQGTLRGEFQNDRLLIKTLNFQNDGTLAIAGPISLAKQQLALELTINAAHYRLLDRSDRKLVVSGNSVVGWREGALQARGSFTADSGFVDIGTTDAPQLSDDVVIVGRSPRQATKTVIALDLGLDLGKGIQVKGRGLDALLLGQIRLLANAGDTLRAEGNLSVKSGTFKAYGRELAIERGQLRFNGALNNPALDILAMRKDQEVEAGVSVGGTVLAPRITLVSDPVVPDAEKLSWLVLGHGLSSAGGGDVGALQAAASSLLAQGAASGLSSQLATAFGLDDFSVGTSNDNLQERIVTLGKKISSRLYVSYQQGLESASSVLLLRYTLTRRVSLEAEAGTRSALSLFYNFAFD